MGNRKRSAEHNRRLEQEANEWFDQVNDEQPFDAFGSTQKKAQLGQELYARIWHDIHQRKRTAVFYMKVAAAIIVLVIAGISIFKYAPLPFGKEQASWIVIEAGAGDYKKITLPDSSVIRLNAASRVRFLSAFNNTAERNIYLEEGAAFFEVSKDAARPFTVFTKGFRIKVLGTSFSVSAYRHQPDLKVQVISGKIKVEQALSPGKVKVLAAEMTKDQRLTVNLATTLYKIEQQTSSKPSAEQHLQQLTLQQIAKELGNKFNLFVQLNNPENDTTVYDVNLEEQSLDALLKTLSTQTGFNYTVVNKQHLIINPKTL